MVNPGGTGIPARVISATPAPLPPRRSRMSFDPSENRYTHLVLVVVSVAMTFKFAPDDQAGGGAQTHLPPGTRGNRSLPGDSSTVALAWLLALAVWSSVTPRDLERRGRWSPAKPIRRGRHMSGARPESEAGCGGVRRRAGRPCRWRGGPAAP